MEIDFGQVVHALSDTIDLVGVDELYHGKRVGFMAMECAKQMSSDAKLHLKLYRLGLLHDCGVSSTEIHNHLVTELEWSDAERHCFIGANRLRQFASLAEFADIVLHHHTRWDELKNLPIDEDVKSYANLIYLTDRMDAISFMEPSTNKLSCRDRVCRSINSLKGSHFKPELVDIVFAAAEKESFWIIQESDHLRDYLMMQMNKPDKIWLGAEQLKKLAIIFAEIVDAKSSYTAQHSLGVSRLAAYLGRRCGLSEDTISALEVAGLLHDLGKLQTPDSILDYPGELKDDFLSIMRQHSFVTFMILKRIKGLDQITEWGADHHEKLNGPGYPFKKSADELSIEARIVGIADIYQALAQKRPYRPSLAPDDIVLILKEEVRLQQIDPELFKIIESDLEQCQAAAAVL